MTLIGGKAIEELVGKMMSHYEIVSLLGDDAGVCSAIALGQEAAA